MTLCVFAMIECTPRKCIYDLLSPSACVFSAARVCVCEGCVRFCGCACERTGVEILRHVTAGGPMPMGKDGAEKETTVATATPSWSG